MGVLVVGQLEAQSILMMEVGRQDSSSPCGWFPHISDGVRCKVIRHEMRIEVSGNERVMPGNEQAEG